ncbi:MAG TPA: hypothetical protein ENJ20_04545 [Bacteroidetes bacterium]|nr:hypothetical protein [Bacteroidota bacterium]
MSLLKKNFCEIKEFLYEFFYYTRAERNAALILAFLCFFFFCLPTIYTLLVPPPPPIDFSEYRDVVAKLMKEPPSGQEVATTTDDEQARLRGDITVAPPVELFSFNPNTATKEELIRLGLSDRTAQTLVNYRAKGGKFFKKEDLKKIYGLRTEDYERLAPWITIEKEKSDSGKKSNKEKKQKVTAGKNQTPAIAQPEKKREIVAQKKKNYPIKRTAAPVIIDINKATPEEWQQLRGIGPYYAKRIVRFRDKLGGFASISQVAETYHLPDSTFQQIKPFLKTSSIFKKININQCSLNELKEHPYISNLQATILFNYRKQHGNFHNMGELKKLKPGFNEKDWKRLEPYLSFGE